MANDPNKPEQNRPEQEKIVIEPISDKTLDEVSGGCITWDSCSNTNCSNGLD